MMLGIAGISQEIKENHNMDETPTKTLLTNKPIFLLEITKSGAPVKIDLNGMEVYLDRSRHQEFVTYPLNDLIATGQNILDIYLMAPEYLDYSLPEDSFVEVRLRVQDDKGDKFTITTLNYPVSEKDSSLGSSESGKYAFLNNEFAKHPSGEVELEKISVSNLQTIYGHKVGGKKLSQSIVLETPFPRWKFLDSDNIIEQNFLEMSLEDVAELRQTPLIRSLYEANDVIFQALKNKKIDSIINLFDERSNDTDIAFYNPHGQTKNGFYQSLDEKVNEAELLEIDFQKRGFEIESNQKVAYLYKAIRFKNHDGSGYTIYSIKFRLENGKWIVTR
jgi:hypothetical protein